MTRQAIKEYLADLRPRYRAATRKAKGVILDEFCKTTGYHRGSAKRALNRDPNQKGKKRLGRPPVYQGGEFMSALLLVWEASGFICGKYLAPGMGGLLERMEACGELMLDSDLRQKLADISGGTIDRLLKPHRQRRLTQPYVRDRVVSDLRHKIAVHTFADLRGRPVGHMETDLVLHCGLTLKGFHLTTLVAVDTATSWLECFAVWGKGKERVAGGVARLHRQVPFTLLGIHTDNGGEFINDTLYGYCQRKVLEFTHSRPYEKNDQPRVEQRNGSFVRRLIGYGRYASHEAHAQLQSVYDLACLQANFFKPTAKLISTERRGAKVTKRYDRPQTPYLRLLASEQLTDAQAAALQERYEQLSPLKLQRQIGAAIDKLWSMEAVDPASEKAERLRRAAKEASNR